MQWPITFMQQISGSIMGLRGLMFLNDNAPAFIHLVLILQDLFNRSPMCLTKWCQPSSCKVRFRSWPKHFDNFKLLATLKWKMQLVWITRCIFTSYYCISKRSEFFFLCRKAMAHCGSTTDCWKSLRTFRGSR